MSENNIINLPILPEFITPSPTEAVLPKEAEVVKINIDDILPNSVIIIKIDQPETAKRMAAGQQISKALRPLSQHFREKNVCFILMGIDESLEVIPETQLHAYGWERKEKSRIITL